MKPLYPRRKRLWGLGMVLGLGLACQERLADVDEEERYVFCAHVNAARVYDEDGELGGFVVGPDGGHTKICLCVTFDEAKDQELRDEVNDEAYEICLANTAAMGYAEANDCADWYAKHHWGDKMFWLWPPNEDPQPCGDENTGGCGMDSEPS